MMTLATQIASMVANHADYIVAPVGVDWNKHSVVNFFSEGVWLCAHNDECNINNWVKVTRLA